MPRHSETKSIKRIIDANINRLKEGLRVCEEIARFIIESHSLTSDFKRIRHEIDRLVKNVSGNTRLALISERDSLRDVGKNINTKELSRGNYQDIFFANMQRAKESARVLEEFSKLSNKNVAIRFKKIRYDIYEVEKKTAKRISPLHADR